MPRQPEPPTVELIELSEEAIAIAWAANNFGRLRVRVLGVSRAELTRFIGSLRFGESPLAGLVEAAPDRDPLGEKCVECDARIVEIETERREELPLGERVAFKPGRVWAICKNGHRHEAVAT